MSWTLVVALCAMGIFGGFAAGLLGIGGGMILVPFMTMIFESLRVPPQLIVHMAIATCLATILFTSISSVRAHHLQGAVQWRIVRLMAPGILVGSWVGPWIGKQMNTMVMALFFGLFVAVAATQMLIDTKPAAHRDLPGPGGMFAAGGVVGVLAGLVGAGGGFISIPFMTWCNVRIHSAVATSAALGFPIALAGTLSNIYFGWGEADLPRYSFGFIYVPALAVIATASVLMAPLGARTAHKWPVRRLRKAFAFILYALAIYMLWKGVALARTK
ncbi:sulfite exporter TauE/SafE family protein [Massilia sp. R2A-15]|uniref:sulfite exporter TauE/SafE family protein n=1 Tax=Massilia sp. R2A-15 TaxID=3064278 RepID=UPI002735849B|nr:sulfite exporter TauE/SafE family protein [Massilia sp. R2A-15]WLI88153.1 sulfite exporter TauE/SafE family protein [Massilia sp. R2A-15]